MWMQAVQHAQQTTDDVGERFAEEARRIHYGEVDVRGIRGQATSFSTSARMSAGARDSLVPLRSVGIALYDAGVLR